MIFAAIAITVVVLVARHVNRKLGEALETIRELDN